MKHQNIFWGTALILLGTLILFDRLGVFIFEWSMLRHLWPVLLIFWGISILPTKGFVKIILALAVAAVTVFIYSEKAPESRGEWKRIEFKKDVDDKDAISQRFSEPMPEGIERASLTLDAGAGAFKMNKQSDNLIDFDKKRSMMKYDFKVETHNEKATIEIKQTSTIHQGTNRKNEVSMQLSPIPLWDFEFNIGAGSFDFDMTELKVENLELNGGAASIDFKLGDLSSETQISIDAAASSITLRVPEGSGCELHSSSVLSSRNIEGFERISKGHYRTGNFDEAGSKITITLNTAVSSFTVFRY
jgi:hypothetical protein